MNHKNTPENFYSKVDKNGPNGCWSWLGSTNRLGYGQLGYQNRRTTAHRLSYELNKGPIPEGKIVRHTCDNPNCCNPEHLLLGTHQDNADDKKARGRQRGPAGTPSINPVYKTVYERQLEQYGACEEGHLLSPDNQYKLVDGTIMCTCCYYTKRDKTELEPIIEEEVLAVKSVQDALRAALDSVPHGYRRRTTIAIYQSLHDIINKELR